MSSAQAPARTRSAAPPAPSAPPARPATRAARPRKGPGRYPGSDDQWQESGACRTANPSLFYGPENESSNQRRFRETAAKAICSHCPVRTLCRAYALQTGELYGIWGGTTERERQARQGSLNSVETRASRSAAAAAKK